MSHKLISLKVALGCMAFASLASVSSASVIWDESINGDLSGDRFAPTTLNLSVGSNRIIGQTVYEDLDYFHVVVPAGTAISNIFLRNYVSDDFAAFLGIQAGTTFTVDPGNVEISDLLGWTLFGPDDVNTDLLPGMGTNFGAIGFVPPLLGSDYSFWLQQIGDETDYELDIVVTPEPATMGLALGLAGLLARRRRRK